MAKVSASPLNHHFRPTKNVQQSPQRHCVCTYSLLQFRLRILQHWGHFRVAILLSDNELEPAYAAVSRAACVCLMCTLSELMQSPAAASSLSCCEEASVFLFVLGNIKTVKQSENTLKMYIYFFLIHCFVVPSLPLLDDHCSLKLGTMGQPATNSHSLCEKSFVYLPRYSNEFQSRMGSVPPSFVKLAL